MQRGWAYTAAVHIHVCLLEVSKQIHKSLRHHAGTVYRLRGDRPMPIGNVKQMGFQTRPEDSHGGCGNNVFGYTVSETSSSDRKSSVADGKQSTGCGRRSVDQ